MGPKYYRKRMQCKVLINLACYYARESYNVVAQYIKKNID